jgi:nicotinamidase-related amidase
VKATALDAIQKGYKTYVIANATAGVEAQPGDEQKAYREMDMAGVKIINTLLI